LRRWSPRAGTPYATTIANLAEVAATAGVRTVHTPKERVCEGVVFARGFPNAPGVERKATP